MCSSFFVAGSYVNGIMSDILFCILLFGINIILEVCQYSHVDVAFYSWFLNIMRYKLIMLFSY